MQTGTAHPFPRYLKTPSEVRALFKYDIDPSQMGTVVISNHNSRLDVDPFVCPPQVTLPPGLRDGPKGRRRLPGLIIAFLFESV